MGSDSGNDGSSKDGPNLFDNMAEDLGNILSGKGNGKHSAYDKRNAEAMSKKTKQPKENFLPGGQYGPRGGSYSASTLHAAGVEMQTAAPSLQDQLAEAKAAPWRGDATPAQQARNIRTIQKLEEKIKNAEAKAIAIAKANQAQAKAQEKAQHFTEKQRAAEAAANAQKAIDRQRVNDYLREMSKPQNQPANRPAGQSAADARKAAWGQAKQSHPSRNAGGVGQHGANHPADVARAQSALAAQGVLDPQHVTGYPGTALVDAIKALQRKHALPVTGTLIPGGQAEAMLNAAAQSQDILGGPRMNEHGNWFDQQGNRIGNPYQNENLQMTGVREVFDKGLGSLMTVFEEAWNGTAAKRRAAEEARVPAEEAKREKEEADRRRAIREIEKQNPGYTVGGNNFNAPFNNGMTAEQKEQMAKEIGTIAGQTLLGGTLKIMGARPGKNLDSKRNLLNNGLDAIGDKVLDSAKKNKDRWGYPKTNWRYLE